MKFIKKLGVAGCSYMAATKNGKSEDVFNSEGKHFTEIIAKHFNSEYCTFARGSSSNTAIHLQVEQLIKENCDLILFSSTSANRIEVQGKSTKTKIYPTIFDFDYYDSPDKSNNYNLFSKNPKFYTQSINNILNEPIIDYKKTNIIKKWFNQCYSEEIKTLQDACIIYSTLAMLEKSKVEYFFLHWEFDILTEKLFQLYPHNYSRIIDSRNPELSCHKWDMYYDDGTITKRRWHTTDDSQSKGAQEWIKFLESKGYGRSKDG